jgi:hypothetical protein
MTAFLEPREGVLIARAGEEIVCPECGEAVAVFLRDFTGDDVPPGPSGYPLDLLSPTEHFATGKPMAIYACICGGECTSSTPLPHLRGAATMFIRSGSWVGWRGLGE